MKKLFYALLIILAILVIGLVVWRLGFSKKDTQTESAQPTKETEQWVKNQTLLFENVTSTDTHKLADGTFRMYLMKDGQIVYADSQDGLVFESPQPTGITEPQGKFISNPAVIEIRDSDWVMVYEEQPQRQPGQKEGPPGPATQRNLMLATSIDGKNFTTVQVAIDSSKEDNYFASVPDLIKTPEGRIRLYYVCGGEATCSAISDDGKVFTKEPGVRMADKAVDPDVLYQGGQWVMYFATLEGAGNKFYKATSADGLEWEKGEIILRPDSSQGAIVDPDVLEISPGNPSTGSGQRWRMFFGEMADAEGQMGGPAQINLYFADFTGDIFE